MILYSDWITSVIPSDCPFGRDDYRRIVNSQDHVLARRLFSWPPWQYDFRKLAATNEEFPNRISLVREATHTLEVSSGGLLGGDRGA